MYENQQKFVIDVSDKDFQEKVIKQSEEIPVVADFFGEWCLPCRRLGPLLEKLAKEYQGKFILAKINVDLARETSLSYGIKGIPAVKMFKKGEVVDEFVGALPENEIKKWLDKNLLP